MHANAAPGLPRPHPCDESADRCARFAVHYPGQHVHEVVCPSQPERLLDDPEHGEKVKQHALKRLSPHLLKDERFVPSQKCELRSHQRISPSSGPDPADARLDERRIDLDRPGLARFLCPLPSPASLARFPRPPPSPASLARFLGPLPWPASFACFLRPSRKLCCTHIREAFAEKPHMRFGKSELQSGYESLGFLDVA